MRATLVIVIAFSCGPFATAEPARPLVQEKPLPPGPLPKGNWQPVDPKVYSAFKKSLSQRGGPPAAVINKAVYVATAKDGLLSKGSFRWEISRSSRNGSVRLRASPLNLAVKSLKWDDRACIWGTGPNGTTQIVVDRNGVLLGEWELRGRRRANESTYRVFLPKAAATTLRLRLPAGEQLTSLSGRVRGPLASSDEDWAIWEVDPGTDRDIVLRTRPLIAPAPPKPRTTASILAEWHISQEGVGLRYSIRVAAYRSPITNVRVTVPKNLRVESVTMAQTTALNWRIARGTPSTLSVDLPDSLLGRSRPIIVRGHLVSTATGTRNLKITVPKVASALQVAGTLVVEIQRPLVLHQASTNGLQQSAIDSSADSETRAYAVENTDAQMEVTIGRESPKLEMASMTALADSREDEQTFRSQVTLRSLRGSSRDVSLWIARGWEVISVSAGSANSGMSWRFVRTENANRIECQLVDSVSSQQSVTLNIVARRVDPAGEEIKLPLIDSLTADIVTRALRIPDSLAMLERGQWRFATEEQVAKLVPDDPQARVLLAGMEAAGTLVAVDRNGLNVADPVAAIQPGQVTASLLIRSELAFAEDAYDRHTATMTHSSPTRVADFDFVLPGAEILSVRGDGSPIAFTRAGNSIRLKGNGDARVISVTYRTRSTAGLRVDFQPPRPAFSTALTQARWIIETPPGVRIHPGNGWFRERPVEPVLWTERLFGPVGRTTGKDLLRFWSGDSWDELLGGQKAQTRQSHSFVLSPSVQEISTLTLWDTRRANRLAWVLFFAAAFLGSFVRLRRVPGRRKLTLIMLPALCGTAFLLPGDWAIFAGAVICGIGLSMLLPTAMLSRAPEHRSKSVPPGSTLHFAPKGAGILLIGAGVLSAMAAFADSESAAPVEEKWAALLPGDSSSPVLVNRELAAEIERVTGGTVLVHEAVYRGRLNMKGVQPIIAFEISIQAIAIGESKPKSLVLPLTDLTLPTKGACKVNGREVAVLRDPVTKSLTIPLPEKQSRYNIRLSGFAAVAGPADSGSTRLRIPPIADAVLILKSNPQVARKLRFPLARGTISQNVKSGVAETTVALGRAGTIEVSWATERSRELPRIEAAIATVAQVSAGHITARTEVALRVSRGPLRRMQFDLPAEVILSEVRLVRDKRDEKLPVRIVKSSAKSLRYELDFEDGIDDRAMLRIRTLSPMRTDKPFGLKVDFPAHNPVVRVNSRTMGFLTPTASTIGINPQGEEIESITGEEFLATIADPDSYDAADITGFRSDEPAEFTVSESKEVRGSARIAQRLTVHRGYAVSLISAQVTTPTNLATYEYILEISDGWEIRKAAVLENGADRILRFSRVGNRVTLFLARPLSGEQKLSLIVRKAHSNRTCELPSVRLAGCDVIDAFVTIDTEKNTRIAWEDRGSLEELAGTATATENQQTRPFGRFRDAGDRTARLRIQSASEVPRARQISELLRTSEGYAWDIRCDVLFPGGAETLLLDVDEFVDAPTIRSSQADVRSLVIRDDRRWMEITPRGEASRITVSLRIPAGIFGKDERVEVPAIRFRNARMDTSLILLPDAAWDPPPNSHRLSKELGRQFGAKSQQIAILVPVESDAKITPPVRKTATSVPVDVATLPFGEKTQLHITYRVPNAGDGKTIEFLLRGDPPETVIVDGRVASTKLAKGRLTVPISSPGTVNIQILRDLAISHRDSSALLSEIPEIAGREIGPLRLRVLLPAGWRNARHDANVADPRFRAFQTTSAPTAVFEQPQSARITLVPTQANRLVVTTIVVLLSVPLLIFLTNDSRRSWMNAHPRFSLFVVGLVWWIGLAWGEFGLLLAGIVFVLMLHRLHARRRSDQSEVVIKAHG